VALKVNEIFRSIQGESSFAGLPCVFIRLTGCNLRCTYCDTRYAYDQGEVQEIDWIIRTAAGYHCRLVEITGGEPLLQPETPELVRRLLGKGFQVLVETNGSQDISRLDPACTRIVDIKCPSSGEQRQNDLDNLARLSPRDEIKFVIGDRRDFQFARELIETHLKLPGVDSGKILFSTVFGKLAPRDLAAWMLEAGIGARLQLQLHKHIWEPDRKGV
jgi:7-carboxy-7-deazaguanine synthase